MMIRRVPLPFFGVALALASVVWIGCATSNGDPLPGETDPGAREDEPQETKQRPTFEAGTFDAPPSQNTPDSAPEPAGGDACIDKDDQGSSETTAKVLPSTSDSDNTTKSVKAVLNGPVDVDFFKLYMADNFTSSVDANFQIETAGVEMCVFVKCASGTTSVTGCSGGVLSTSSIGTKGCCATGPSQATPQWDCPGLTDDDSADFYIRLKQSANKCTSYSWTYHF